MVAEAQDLQPVIVADGPPRKERTIRFRDTSAGGLREKARFVLGRMEQRIAVFGKNWRCRDEFTLTSISSANFIRRYYPIYLGYQLDLF
jgi:hypothetical protein